jgi:hypothetical protein
MSMFSLQYTLLIRELFFAGRVLSASQVPLGGDRIAHPVFFCLATVALGTDFTASRNTLFDLFSLFKFLNMEPHNE